MIGECQERPTMRLTGSTVTSNIVQESIANGLRGRIAGQIRESIVNGNLPAGERLVERKLASELGASITAVREAMIELETEGYLVKKVNFATHVINLSWAEVDKVFAVRRVLEGFAVQTACSRALPDEVQHLADTYREMLEAARGLQSSRFNNADIAFHIVLWKAAHNEYLEMALRRALLPLFAFGAIRAASQDASELARDADSHLPMLEAIRNRDPQEGLRAFHAGWDYWYGQRRCELTGATANV
jgi:DNA-binding GntR family transcriptional regulator